MSVEEKRGESSPLWRGAHMNRPNKRRKVVSAAGIPSQSAANELRAVAARIQSMRENERKRLAREIYDQLGQSLAAIKINLCFLLRDLPSEEKTPSPEASSILKLLDESIHTVRRISTDLRPVVLDDLGLVAALEWAAEDFQDRTGIACRLDLPPDTFAVDTERDTAVFRIFQEILNNVAQHAKASEVVVRLAGADDHVTLEVHDNGIGISAGKLKGQESLGILGMRDLATMLEGELSISGVPGKGTSVRVRIPVRSTVGQLQG